MAKVSDAVSEVDEAFVRELFSRFDRKEDFFSDPQATWIDEPHYRVVSQNLEMRTRGEVLAWFQATFDALPDLQDRKSVV